MIHRSRYDFVWPQALYFLTVSSALLVSTLVVTPESLIHGIVEPPQTERTPKTLFLNEVFAGVQVKAKAFVVYDIVDNQIIASKNEQAVLPLASLTKIMTAVTARMHNDGAAQVRIDEPAEGKYDLGLKKNQVWSLNELLKYTLVFSSNDGAFAIATQFGGVSSFVQQMNLDSQALGFLLRFTDPAGLDVGTSLGGEGTALDVAKLLAYARKSFPELFDATTKQRTSVIASTGKLTGVPNTNQDINNITEAEASKTGFTDSAGGNLAIIVDITVGHPVAIVVLGSTREERFKDVEILYKLLKVSLIQ